MAASGRLLPVFPAPARVDIAGLTGAALSAIPDVPALPPDFDRRLEAFARSIRPGWGSRLAAWLAGRPSSRHGAPPELRNNPPGSAVQ